MKNNTIELNETNFHEEVINASHPVMVAFWAEWSAPCRELSALLQSAAEDGSVPVKLGRVDVESQEKLTEQCGVRAAPTVLIYNQGAVQDQIIGHTTTRAVRELLDRLTWDSSDPIAAEAKRIG